MTKKVASLEVKHNDKGSEELINTLKTAGFIVVLDTELIGEDYYIVAKEVEE